MSRSRSSIATLFAVSVLSAEASADLVQAEEVNSLIQSDRVYTDTEALIRGNMEAAGFDTETKAELDRLLINREYEMAFEGFFVELMTQKRQININAEKCRELGRMLGLDRHSVYDAEFWRKFESYLAGETQKSPLSRS